MLYYNHVVDQFFVLSKVSLRSGQYYYETDGGTFLVSSDVAEVLKAVFKPIGKYY